MFREATGENFSDYKRRTRLERVKWELARSDLPVTTIAIEAGFTSFSVFNRAFKDAFGVTPSQYRREQAAQRQEEGSGAAMDRVFRILQREKQAQDSRNDHVYRVEGDITQGVPRKRRQNQLLNVGPAHLLQGAAMQNQVAFSGGAAGGGIHPHLEFVLPGDDAPGRHGAPPSTSPFWTRCWTFAWTGS